MARARDSRKRASGDATPPAATPPTTTPPAATPAAGEPAASAPPLGDSALNPEDTQVIVRSAQRDEQRAWTLLSAKVLFFLRSRFGGVSLPAELELDDFGSEVMLRVLTEIRRFVDQGKGSFWGWVYMLAQNRLNDLWRAHNRRSRLGLRGSGETEDEAATRSGSGSLLDNLSDRSRRSPVEEAHTEELAAIERDCAARLPGTMAQIYLLRRREELSFAEISQRFGGIKEVTLRSYFLRSREFVKDCIRRKLDDLGATFEDWQR